MNQNKSYSQSCKITKSYGSVNVYDNIRDKWIRIQTQQVGDLKFSAHSNDHNGWLICDGRSLSRTDYAELYDVVGISFGANNGSTFKIPDMRGRVAGGIGDGPSTTDRPLGTSLGEEEHTLTVGEMPTHSHTGTTQSNGEHSHSINDPGHTHNYTTHTGDQAVHTLSTQDSAADQADINTLTDLSTTGITINLAGAHTHTFTTNTTGNSFPHNNMQPTLFIGNMFIYGPKIKSAF